MSGAAAGANHRSDVGRRCAERREQLGLSREDVAERAGIAPEYLRYLEEQASSPSIPSLTRVARALQTTVAELSGVTAPSGAPTPPGRPGELTELSSEECHELLAAHTLGRVAVATPEGPAIVPVNYTFVEDEDAVVFPTTPDVIPFTEGDEVAFEVDRLDEALHVGWSVMLAGEAHQITDPAALARLEVRQREEPWVVGERPMWVRVAAERLSGHRVPLG